MASRGSVIPLFLRQVFNGDPITITDPNMTRFMMTLDDAVDLVIHAFEHGSNGDIFVQKAPAATIQTLVDALLKVADKAEHTVNVIGTRHGENCLKHCVVAKKCLLPRIKVTTIAFHRITET